MIIRISLSLMLASFALLLVADLLLALALPTLSAAITQLALATLLCASTLLLLAGGFLIGRLTLRSFRAYCSEQQRVQRRLAFVQAQQKQLKQLHYFRTVQINYFKERQRQHLLSSNNRKHIHSLAKAIDQDLLLLKHQLPKTTYRQLQQETARYKNRQDSEGLLHIQQKLAQLD